jgi:hypothetical protein
MLINSQLYSLFKRDHLRSNFSFQQTPLDTSLFNDIFFVLLNDKQDDSFEFLLFEKIIDEV